MVKWKLVYTSQAKKDAKKLTANNLQTQAQKLLTLLTQNPLKNPPPYETLVGDLAGLYSRRINIQHRLVYQIYKKERTVKVIRMYTHYE